MRATAALPNANDTLRNQIHLLCVSAFPQPIAVALSLEGFNWESLTPNWAILDEQVARLAPPTVMSPPIVPDT